MDLRLSDLLNDESVSALLRGEVEVEVEMEMEMEMEMALGVVLALLPQIDAHVVQQDALVAVLPSGHRLARRARLAW